MMDSPITRVTALFADLQPVLAEQRGLNEALSLITHQGVKLLDGAEHAAVTIGRKQEFKTVAETSELPPRVDAVQYELRSGPCVDAVVEQTVFITDDLARENRWPEFGRRAATLGVRSMLSYRMFLENEARVVAGLNFYSSEREAFSLEDRALGLILSTHGAVIISNAGHTAHIADLEQALASNRQIGVAIGILMALHKLSQDQAFDALRVASQHTHRKLRDIADDVVHTGTIQLPT